MKRVVLLGAGGMLAADLADLAPPDVTLFPLGIADVDIKDAAALAASLDRTRPDVVINAAAYTQVDRAESDYAMARAVNGTAVTRLGELCADRGAQVVHFSTDYVFDGTGDRPYREDDPVSPVNAYGRSKLEGERGLAASGASALILRTQWLFGTAGQSFPRTMWRRATAHAPTRVVADQFGRPTSTIDLARATWALVQRNAVGLYHLANGGPPTTWFEIARSVFTAADALPALTPCTTSEYPTPARRPAFSVLDTALVEREHGIALPPWMDALEEFVTTLRREP